MQSRCFNTRCVWKIVHSGVRAECPGNQCLLQCFLLDFKTQGKISVTMVKIKIHRTEIRIRMVQIKSHRAQLSVSGKCFTPGNVYCSDFPLPVHSKVEISRSTTSLIEVSDLHTCEATYQAEAKKAQKKSEASRGFEPMISMILV